MSRQTSPLGPAVTRRDFIGRSLVGSGAVLLSGCGSSSPDPAAGIASGPDASWNGPSGTGDYAGSNGNTLATAQAGHQIRDGAYPERLTNVVDSGESYDLVIVGGGFTGLGALHEFRRSHPNKRALLLDNQEIFGGYGKANAFALGGMRLQGPQASLNFLLPESKEDRGAQLWAELGLPSTFAVTKRSGGDPAIKFASSTSGPLYLGEQSASVGYWFGPKAGFVRDIWSDDLARAPFSGGTREALLRLRARRRQGKPEGAEARRLDQMTFADYARTELGATDEALAYITQGMNITGPQISAFGARSLPGLERYNPGSKEARLAERFLSFPGGNALLARAMVKSAIPAAFAGPSSLEALDTAQLNRAALDASGQPARIRQGATVVRVAHLGEPESAEQVEVIYAQAGKLRRVKARGVVLGIGSWVTKHIVGDLPDERRMALGKFLYSPMLMVNVAVRNWRFLDRAGISAARWFDGLGFFTNVRQPLQLGRQQARFGPDHPTVMTMYVPFPNPKLPLEAQGPAARQQLYETPFADYEQKVVEQFSAMFGRYGFDAKRDIAGLILNRWGHAYVTPPPGFFFGLGDEPAPLDLATKRHGRVAFGQSGLEDWVGATEAGRRAVQDLSLT